MDTALPKDDLVLHSAFDTIAKTDTVSEYIREIANLVVHDELTRENIQSILSKIGYKVQDIKNELLDMLISYANVILEDGIITDKEKRNFGFLKLYFGIKPNDFYKHKLFEITEILHYQFEKLYFDNNISKEEAEHGVELQDMFGLSYAQFDKLKEKEIIKAIERGANIVNLDTANVKLIKLLKNEYGIYHRNRIICIGNNNRYCHLFSSKNTPSYKRASERNDYQSFDEKCD